MTLHIHSDGTTKTLSLSAGGHVAITNPDDRGRFQLKRWTTREPVSGWRVYRSEDGKTVLLEAVEA
jgi:expansin (peptidoglycan-binding protein)